MPTFVVLTRLSPEAVRSPAALEQLERQAMDRVRQQCPGVEWIGSYAILGPCLPRHFPRPGHRKGGPRFDARPHLRPRPDGDLDRDGAGPFQGVGPKPIRARLSSGRALHDGVDSFHFEKGAAP